MRFRPIFACLLVQCAFLAALAIPQPAGAVTRHVYTAADFNSLPTTLNAGDLVVLHDGIYSGLTRTFTSSIADDETAQTNPARIYAERPGGVVVTGPSAIVLRGRGIVLAGIDFAPGSGGVISGTTAQPIINLDVNSRFMRLNNLRFTNCSPPAPHDDRWIRVQGFNHTIEYCSFFGKQSKNVMIALTRATSNEAGATTPRHHAIRYCYFGPRECSVTDNGYESMRIGDSSSQIYDMRVVVEHNVFYRAIWRDDGQKPNDPEIISNKSRGNIIRHNTLLESTGQITLRHGDACIVEGNYIFGAGYYSADGTRILLRPTPNPYQGGIRIIGQDHIVRNNYLINLRSTGGRAALCLMAGAEVWDDGDGTEGDNGYEPADRAEIYHNTFIDCGEMNLGFVDTGSRQPVGVKVFNNAWQSTVSGKGIVRNAAFTPQASGGNYVNSTGELGWTELGGTFTKTTSAQLTEPSGNLLVPAATSPLLNSAAIALTAEFDLRGLPRPATGRDIGAYEREVVGAGMRPLLRNEVGPEFDGGPSGNYAGATVPVILLQPLPQQAQAGASVTLSVAASSTPAPSFQWLRDGVDITGNATATASTLLLANIRESDAGTYAVRVSNAAGSILSATVSVAVSAPDPFAAFIQLHGLEGVAAGALADPDGDGYVNLIEFLTGGDPTESDRAFAPTLTRAVNGAVDEWIMSFRIAAVAGTTNWSLEHSADLAQWSVAADGVAGVRITSTPAGEAWRDVSVSIPATAPQIMARLRVSKE